MSKTYREGGPSFLGGQRPYLVFLGGVENIPRFLRGVKAFSLSLGEVIAKNGTKKVQNRLKSFLRGVNRNFVLGGVIILCSTLNRRVLMVAAR